MPVAIPIIAVAVGAVASAAVGGGIIGALVVARHNLSNKLTSGSAPLSAIDHPGL